MSGVGWCRVVCGVKDGADAESCFMTLANDSETQLWLYPMRTAIGNMGAKSHDFSRTTVAVTKRSITRKPSLFFFTE